MASLFRPRERRCSRWDRVARRVTRVGRSADPDPAPCAGHRPRPKPAGLDAAQPGSDFGLIRKQGQGAVEDYMEPPDAFPGFAGNEVPQLIVDCQRRQSVNDAPC